MSIKPHQFSLDTALEQLLSKASGAKHIETVAIHDALNCYLAKDVYSCMDVPPAANSQMDGYAVSSQACAVSGTVLIVTQRIAAGQVSNIELQPGQAARIFTGAFLPVGADAVVMQEQCALSDDKHYVTINQAVPARQWVREQGSDVRKNECILKAGTQLNPIALGLLASIGLSHVQVYKPLRVGLMCTGDELTPPGQPLPLGHIYNSNRPMLTALLQRLGCVVLDTGDIADTLQDTQTALKKLAQTCDLIVSTGGVSVGEEDHVRAAVETLGAIDVWNIAIKPGKPFAFGHVKSHVNDTVPFLGLPGNPVAALLTFMLLVRPFIQSCYGGGSAVTPQAIWVKSAFAWQVDRRREFLRVRLNTASEAELFHNQNSGVLTSAVWADGFVDIDIGQVIKPGDLVKYIPLNNIL